jgi:hypothetical protein
MNGIQTSLLLVAIGKSHVEFNLLFTLDCSLFSPSEQQGGSLAGLFNLDYSHQNLSSLVVKETRKLAPTINRLGAMKNFEDV